MIKIGVSIGFLLTMLIGIGCVLHRGENITMRTYPTPLLEYPIYQSLNEIDASSRDMEKSDELQVTLEVHWVVIDYLSKKVKLGVSVRFYNLGSDKLYIKKPTPIRPDYDTNLRAIFSSCPFRVLDNGFVTLIPDPLYDLSKDQFISIDPNDYYEYTESATMRISSSLYSGGLEKCIVLVEYDNIYIGYEIEPEDWIPEREIRKATSHLTPEEYSEWISDHTLYVDLDAFIGRVKTNTVLIEEHIVLNE